MTLLRKISGILAVILLLCTALAGCVAQSLSLSIDSPEDGTELDVNVIKVRGMVSDHRAMVTVNGIAAKVAQDGSFSSWVQLMTGPNTIEVVATLGDEDVSKTITVTFNPALAVYLEMPRPEIGTDYTKTPLKVSGTVSNPEATVTVNGSDVEVSEDGSFSTEVQLIEGVNSIEAVAKLGEQRDSAVIMLACSPEGIISPVPGRSHFDDAFLRYDDSVELKAGETKLLDVTLEARKDGPGEVIYAIYRVAEEYAEHKVPVPEGFAVSIEPSKFIAYPNTIYHSTITIETTPELVPGEYWLRFEQEFENAFRGSGWIKVNVEP
jgi:hypothetical protein